MLAQACAQSNLSHPPSLSPASPANQPAAQQAQASDALPCPHAPSSPVLPCSGTITVDELRESLKRKGALIPEAELHRIMAMADVNGDGTIDYEEFMAATLYLGGWSCCWWWDWRCMLECGSAGVLELGCDGADRE